jgi:segregation and condensation protein B
MEIGNIIPHIEALIFASDKPLTAMEITELINNAFGFMEEKLTLEQIQTSIDGIREKYDSEFYPFEVKESGGGWQFLTKKDFHKTVAQLNGEKFLKRLSSAALETLAIIAYKQPITKGEIESIRGVSSDYSIQKLLEKELIVIAGRNENMVGKPLIYTTSKTFMDYFGINSADDLPKLKEVFADTLVEPTLINHTPAGYTETGAAGEEGHPGNEHLAAEGETITGAALVVTEVGELLEGTAGAGSAAAESTSPESEASSEAESSAETPSTKSPAPPEDSEESDETPDGDAASLNDLDGDELTDLESEAESNSAPLSESDEEGDDEADLSDDETHDPATDKSDEDGPLAGADDESGEDDEPHHDPASDESDEDSEEDK